MGEGVHLLPEVFSLHAHLHANVTSLGRTVNPPRLYPPSFNPSPLRISTLRCALIFKVEHDFAVQFTLTESLPTSKTGATPKHHISDRTHKRDQTRPDQERDGPLPRMADGRFTTPRGPGSASTATRGTPRAAPSPSATRRGGVGAGPHGVLVCRAVLVELAIIHTASGFYPRDFMVRYAISPPVLGVSQVSTRGPGRGSYHISSACLLIRTAQAWSGDRHRW